MIAVILRFWVDDGSELLDIKDLIKFIRLGFCDFMSHVTISSKTYNITNQLWYLYGGVVAIFILYVTRSKWFSRTYNVLVCLLAIVPIILSYVVSVKIPQFVYLSIPSIYLGICIKRYNHVLFELSTKQILTSIGISAVFVYTEYFLSVTLMNE